MKQSTDVSARVHYYALAAVAWLEAWLLFILPDFFLGPYVAHYPQRWRAALLASFIGSLVGAVLLYVAVLQLGSVVQSYITSLPFTSAVAVAEVEVRLGDGSLTDVLRQAYSGIPAKVWTTVAALEGVSTIIFFSFLILSRFSRMALVTLIGYSIGTYLPRPNYVWYWTFSGLYVLGFFYILTLL